MPALHELGPAPRFLFSRVFPWLILALGLFTLYLGIQTMVGGWASKSWPNVPGLVSSSKLETEHMSSDSTRGSGLSYHARVHYDYEVGGEAFGAKRVSFGEFGTGDAEHAKGVLGRYPAGAEVELGSVGEFVAAIATLVTLAHLGYRGDFADHVDSIHAEFWGAS